MNATMRLLYTCHCFLTQLSLCLGLTFLESKECFLDTVQAKLQVSVGWWLCVTLLLSGDMVALLTILPPCSCSGAHPAQWSVVTRWQCPTSEYWQAYAVSMHRETQPFLTAIVYSQDISKFLEHTFSVRPSLGQQLLETDL